MLHSPALILLVRSAVTPTISDTLPSLMTLNTMAANFSFFKVWGAPAWWLWGVIHIGFLVGVCNCVSVMFDWFWAYLTFRSGTRLITASSAPDMSRATAIKQLAA